MEIPGALKGVTENFRRSEAPKPSRMVDVYNMTPEDNAALARRVDTSGGEIDILVHPYYQEYISYSNDRSPLNPEYGIGRELLLRGQANPNGKPLVVFEER